MKWLVKSSSLVTIFPYAIDNMYIHLQEKIDKILAHVVDATWKIDILFCSHEVLTLTIECTPRVWFTKA